MLGPEMIMEASEKVEEIREKIKTAQDRQKCYADKRRRDLEFSIGDDVFLKVLPLKNVIRFGRKGKLAARLLVRLRLRKGSEPWPIESHYQKSLPVCTMCSMSHISVK